LRLKTSTVVAVFAAVAAAASLSACMGAKKKPELAYVERPVDQLYATGAARLDQRRWQEAVDYFEEVERQHPYSEWSRRAILMTAYAYYEGNQYEDAIAAAERFIQLYPGSPSAAYAYYLKAICHFEQIMDVQRDQGSTQNALAALTDVARRYPTSDYAADARVKIDMVNDQLAGKEMAVGRWYLRQNQPLAAIGRFKSVIDKHQTTSHTPEALYRLVEAYLTLGLVEEAKRNAAVLGHNFPGDRWYQDAFQMMERRGQPLPDRPTPASATRRASPDPDRPPSEASPAPEGLTTPPADEAAAEAATEGTAEGAQPAEQPRRRPWWKRIIPGQ